MIGFDVRNDIGLGWIRVGRWRHFSHVRWSESILSLWDRWLLRGFKGRGGHSRSNRFRMSVVSGSRQFFFLCEVMVIKFIDSASVAMHACTHSVMSACLSKSWVFFIGVGWWGGYLLFCFILKTIDVQLLSKIAAKADRPAIWSGYIGTKSSWLCVVIIGRRQRGMLIAGIVTVKSLLSRSEGMGCGICEIFSPVEVTVFVKDGVWDVFGVLLERWESARFAKGKLLLRYWTIQRHSEEIYFYI